MEGRRLMDDRADTVRFDNAPDEERDARYWDHYCLHGEQMPAGGLPASVPAGGREITHILWMGNQMAGREMSQKRKKHIKSFVVVPEDAGRWLADGWVSSKTRTSEKLPCAHGYCSQAATLPSASREHMSRQC